MKTKQLANVLVKILGLSVIVHALPSVLSGLFSLTQIPRGAGGSVLSYGFFALSSLLTIGMGVFLILKSREVVDYLFKDEVE